MHPPRNAWKYAKKRRGCKTTGKGKSRRIKEKKLN